MQKKIGNKILVTGVAGFIGFHLAKRLLDEGFQVIGLDNLNDYYNVDLKYDRLKELGVLASAAEYNVRIESESYSSFQFYKLNLEDRAFLPELFKEHKFKIVCNLAAQAGVRYSLENPEAT